MARLAQIAALLAICGIVFVLITPAPDELPCVTPHGTLPALALSLPVISIVHPLLLSVSVPLASLPLHFSNGTTLLSFNCTLLC